MPVTFRDTPGARFPQKNFSILSGTPETRHGFDLLHFRLTENVANFIDVLRINHLQHRLDRRIDIRISIRRRLLLRLCALLRAALRRRLRIGGRRRRRLLHRLWELRWLLDVTGRCGNRLLLLLLLLHVERTVQVGGHLRLLGEALGGIVARL